MSRSSQIVISLVFVVVSYHNQDFFYYYIAKILIYKSRSERPKYKGPFSTDYKERGSYTRGVYPTQYTSP